MVVDHAKSVTFSFGILLRQSSLPFLDEVHNTLLFIIRNWRRLRAGRNLPISEQSLGLYHFFGVFVVSHEESVVLLIIQVFLALVVRLEYEYTPAEFLAGRIHRPMHVFLSFCGGDCLFVNNPLCHHQYISMLVIQF